MGLLDVLKGIGSALPVVGPAIGAVGNILGKQAEGASQGRMTEAELQTRMDALKNQQFNTQQGAQMDLGKLDLERQQFGTDNRAQLAKQALLAQLLGGGFQGTKIDIPGIKSATISGGLGESIANNPAIREAMATMGAQAKTAQNTPLSYQGGNIVKAPTLSTIPQASGWEKTAGIGGILGQIGGTLGGMLPSSDGGTATNPTPSSQTAILENLKRLIESGVRF